MTFDSMIKNMLKEGKTPEQIIALVNGTIKQADTAAKEKKARATKEKRDALVAAALDYFICIDVFDAKDVTFAGKFLEELLVAGEESLNEPKTPKKQVKDADFDTIDRFLRDLLK